MKILVLGYTQSGKSTAAEILADYLHSKYLNTSDQLVLELAQKLGITTQHILENKEQYRQQLFTYGRAKQATDPLWPQSVQIKSADILTGLRSPDEIRAARDAKLYNMIVWINRPGIYAGPTDKLDSSYADVIINNDGTIDDLRSQLLEQVKLLQ